MRDGSLQPLFFVVPLEPFDSRFTLFWQLNFLLPIFFTVGTTFRNIPFCRLQHHYFLTRLVRVNEVTSHLTIQLAAMGLNSASLSAYLLAVASLAHAHVLLKTPVPYGAATLNTNPLLADGSDYPW